MTVVATMTPGGKLRERDFRWVSEHVKELCGINLHGGKKALVKARLGKRLRQLGIDEFEEYIELLKEDGEGTEIASMLDVLSTNQTSFFRDPIHFDFLAREVVHSLPKRRVRIWSAGCSSGEEPYSIAISLLQCVSDPSSWDLGILGTDLSRRCLAAARAGLYPERKLQNMPLELRARYFVRRRCDNNLNYEVNRRLKELASFARLNLMDSWPMRGPFDVIFCRNVMIYFDHETQAALVNRLTALIRPGGFLFIGPSESLTSLKHNLRYVRPTIYQRP